MERGHAHGVLPSLLVLYSKARHQYHFQNKLSSSEVIGKGLEVSCEDILIGQHKLIEKLISFTYIPKLAITWLVTSLNQLFSEPPPYFLVVDQVCAL